jgi:hypothetical protein
VKAKSRNIIRKKRVAIARRASEAFLNFKKGFIEQGSVKDLHKNIESI